MVVAACTQHINVVAIYVYWRSEKEHAHAVIKYCVKTALNVRQLKNTPSFLIFTVNHTGNLDE